MKKFFKFMVFYFLKIAFWFRYRVTVKGLENLNSETLNKPGGILFLPNHPTVFVDPTLVSMAVWPKFPIRPMVVEYMYYTPIVHGMMKFLDALPIPNFNTASNTLKQKKAEKVVHNVITDLRKGDNFLIYPAGRLKQTEKEVIGGASGVHQIVQEVPEANIVLVRTKGLWGSSFSRALIGTTPGMFSTILQGMKKVLKNLIFFTPRREVIIEFEPAPADFPYKSKRREFNEYLEHWYDRPDGLSAQKGEYPGESLVLVSYSMWGNDFPTIKKETASLEEKVDVVDVSSELQNKVIGKLAEIANSDPQSIALNMSLSTDLGLDSLDIAEIVAFLKDQFEVDHVPFQELTTVSRVIAIAARKIEFEEEVEEDTIDLSKWKTTGPRVKAQIAEGKTLPEVFLNNCARMGKAVACADAQNGILTYTQLKMRALVLAEYIRHLPGEYIGILLPASVAAYLTVIACEVAGKIPLLINWTIGSRHLEAVVKLSNVEVVLSSWRFLDKLQDADLKGVEDLLVMLEDVKREITLGDKLRAAFRAKRSTKAILKTFGTHELTPKNVAVLLFTSGTESLPKGVPLTHHNVLSNQRASFEAIPVFSDDVIYGFLPPFHAFGFSISGLMGLLAGIRTVYFPDPTDGVRLAKGIEKWKVTVTCGAPTFIRSIAKAATPEQFKTIRLCVTGAEKAPPELFKLMKGLGKEGCLFEGYGITECSPVLTAPKVGKPRKGVGEPLPGVELSIVHPETYAPMPVGKRGLILVRGPNVFSGYLNPGLTSPFVFIDGKEWYNTGDLGYVDEEGELMISGRVKRFIKVGAEMVSLPSIEDTLLQAAIEKDWVQVEDTPTLAVCAKEVVDEKPKIFLFTRFTVSLEEVNKTLREAGFSNLVRIASITKLPEIPIMGTGKINYRVLEEKYL